MADGVNGELSNMRLTASTAGNTVSGTSQAMLADQRCVAAQRRPAFTNHSPLCFSGKMLRRRLPLLRSDRALPLQFFFAPCRRSQKHD